MIVHKTEIFFQCSPTYEVIKRTILPMNMLTAVDTTVY